MGLTFRYLGGVMDRVPYAHPDALARVLGRGGVLLDVGGGTGRIARRVRDGFRRVVIADVERSMLERARASGFDTVIADARHLPFKERAVDAVMMVDAFHHFPDQDVVIREGARVLHPDGGRLVVEEFDPGSVTGALVVLVERVAGFGSRFHRPDALAARVTRLTGLPARVTRFNRRDYAVVADARGL